MSEPSLDLTAGVPVLPLDRPFTRADAATAGVSRAAFARWVRHGTARRLLRGVYAAATATYDPAFRAEAVRLALRGDVVAVGRTAAWLHGAPVARFSRPGQPPVPTERRARGALPPRDVVAVRGVAVTSPLRTALDLARDDDDRVALAAIDRLLGAGTLSQVALLAGLAFGPHDAWVRELAVQADGRADGPVESVLRLHWLRSALPTPVPGLVVPGRSAAVRLALAVPDRRFGALLRSSVGGPAASPDDLARLREAGWWLVVLDDARVLGAGPEVLRRHLEREFHQALLAEVG